MFEGTTQWKGRKSKEERVRQEGRNKVKNASREAKKEVSSFMNPTTIPFVVCILFPLKLSSLLFKKKALRKKFERDEEKERERERNKERMGEKV